MHSPDLVWESFSEQYPTKKQATEALNKHKLKFLVTSATIRYCRDVVTYSRKEIS